MSRLKIVTLRRLVFLGITCVRPPTEAFAGIYILIVFRRKIALKIKRAGNPSLKQFKLTHTVSAHVRFLFSVT